MGGDTLTGGGGEWTQFRRLERPSGTIESLYGYARGSQRDVVYLDWPIAPSIVYKPKYGGWRGWVAGSQPMSTAVQCAYCFSTEYPRISLEYCGGGMGGGGRHSAWVVMRNRSLGTLKVLKFGLMLLPNKLSYKRRHAIYSTRFSFNSPLSIHVLLYSSPDPSPPSLPSPSPP